MHIARRLKQSRHSLSVIESVHVRHALPHLFFLLTLPFVQASTRIMSYICLSSPHESRLQRHLQHLHLSSEKPFSLIDFVTLLWLPSSNSPEHTNPISHHLPHSSQRHGTPSHESPSTQMAHQRYPGSTSTVIAPSLR